MKININRKNGAFCFTAVGCDMENIKLYPPIRTYDADGGGYHVHGMDGQTIYIPANAEICVDGEESDLETLISEMETTEPADPCCPENIQKLTEIRDSIQSGSDPCCPENLSLLKSISTTVATESTLVELRDAVLANSDSCCPETNAHLANIVSLLEDANNNSGSFNPPLVDSMEGLLVSGGSETTLIVNGSSFEDDSIVSFLNANHVITSQTVLSDTQIQITVSPGSDVGVFDVSVTAGEYLYSGTSGYGKGEAVSIVVEPITWLDYDYRLELQGEGGIYQDSTVANWYSSGSHSEQGIAFGDGYVEATYDKTNGNYVMFGMGKEAADSQEWTNIAYCMYVYSGNINIYESGTPKGNMGALSVGDVLRVEILAGVVVYKKNGIVMYSSNKQPTYPMLADVAIYNQNSGLASARISGVLI